MGNLRKSQRRHKLLRQNGWKVAVVGGTGIVALVASLAAFNAQGHTKSDPLGVTVSERALKLQRDEASKIAAAEQARLERLLQVTLPANRPLKIAFVGDSLTFGLYASSESAGYRPQVVSALEQHGVVEWDTAGKTGNTVAAVADTVSPQEETDLTILALGTNDAWKTDVDLFRDKYADMTSRVRDSAPGTAVLCLGLWVNADGARLYDPHVKSACESVGGRFVPLVDLFVDNANHGRAGVEAFGGVSDTFHPNDAGYKAIAERILSEIHLS